MSTKRTLRTHLATIGQRAAESERALHHIALEVSKAASQGQIQPDDATDLYLQYFGSAHPGKKISANNISVRTNTSKLRQIIKAADPDLLARVVKLHNKLQPKREVKRLYEAMVDACRASMSKGVKLSDGQLTRIILK